MRNLDTPANKRETVEDASNKSYWSYIGVLLSIIVLSLTLLTANAQNGKLKFKGSITNVDESERTLVTLSQLYDNNEAVRVLGQYVVQGNDWFKTYMETEKRYVLEIASSNGLTKRYYINMDVPEDIQSNNHKLEMTFDMAHSGKDWPVVASGEIIYDDNSDDFALVDWVQESSIALGKNK